MKNRKNKPKLGLTINPFVNRAQQKACYAKDDPKWDCAQWSAETKKLKGKQRAIVRNLLRRKAKQQQTLNEKTPAKIRKYSPNKIDPSRTFGMRRAFGAKIKRSFAKIKGKIIALLVKDDAFGLNATSNFNPFHGVHGLFASSDAAGGSSTDDPVQDYQNRGVHARSFKQWFGDWEHDPENASKVVDDDGKPRATNHVDSTAAPNGHIIRVYHGSPTGGFTNIDPSRLGDDAVYGKGVYFTESKEIAEQYATHDWHGDGGSLGKKPAVLECYLNIRKPFDCDRPLSDNMKHMAFNYFRKLDIWGDPEPGSDKISTANPWENGSERPMTGNDLCQRVNDLDKLKGGKSITTFLQNLGFDGLVRTDHYIPGKGFDDSVRNRTWVAFQPHQVKAVANRGTFNPNDTNIYNTFFNEEEKEVITNYLINYNPNHGEHGRFSSSSTDIYGGFPPRYPKVEQAYFDSIKGQPQETVVGSEHEGFAERDATIHRLLSDVNKADYMHDAQKEHFKKIITEVVSNMPEKAAKELIANTTVFRPMVNPTEVKKALEKEGPTGLPDDAKVFGFYNRKEESLNPDGLKNSKEDSYTIKGVFAHESMHAIDGPNDQFSHSAEWYEAAGTEIQGHPEAISSYATTEPAEAFAEFGRALYAGHIPKAVLEKRLPLCCDFFKRKGLWPKS